MTPAEEAYPHDNRVRNEFAKIQSSELFQRSVELARLVIETGSAGCVERTAPSGVTSQSAGHDSQ